MYSCKKAAQLIICGLFMFLAACGGSGSSDGTNGTITLSLAATDLSGGLYDVKATALCSIADSTIPITMSTTVFTLSGTTQSFTDDLRTDSTGTVTRSYQIQQTTQTLYVKVRAYSQGLSDEKTISIPGLTGMSASPAAIGFSATDAAGTTKTLTVSGGLAPYTATINTTDLSIVASGANSWIVTKLTGTPGLGATGKTAQIVIKDSTNAQLIVPVSYF